MQKKKKITLFSKILFGATVFSCYLLVLKNSFPEKTSCVPLWMSLSHFPSATQQTLEHHAQKSCVVTNSSFLFSAAAAHMGFPLACSGRAAGFPSIALSFSILLSFYHRLVYGSPVFK